MIYTSIKNLAFYGCNSLSDVYYSGAEEQWNKISVYSGSNLPLLNATIHYNSTGPDTPSGGNLRWDDDTQQTLEVGKTLTLTVQMGDGSTLDASRLNWMLNPALSTAEIVDQGAVDEKTAYVTLKGVYPGKVTLTGTLAPAPGESILNRPTVSQEITVIGSGSISFDQDTYAVTAGEATTLSVNVPNPNGLTVDDISIISSDKTVADVTSMKGPDIEPSGTSSLVITVGVRGFKVGTATFTANTTDGRSASCEVIVQEKPEIRFDPDIYHANWLRTKSGANKALDRDPPSTLLRDPFTGALNNCWVAFSAILSAPSDLYSTAEYFSGFSQRDMYEALLLDALQASVSYELFPKTLKEGTGYAKDLFDYISEGIKADYNLDLNNVEDYQKFVEQQGIESNIDDYINKWFEKNYLGLSITSDITKKSQQA